MKTALCRSVLSTAQRVDQMKVRQPEGEGLCSDPEPVLDLTGLWVVIR